MCVLLSIQRKAAMSALSSIALVMDQRVARGPGAAGANEPPAEQVLKCMYRANTRSAWKKVLDGIFLVQTTAVSIGVEVALGVCGSPHVIEICPEKSLGAASGRLTRHKQGVCCFINPTISWNKTPDNGTYVKLCAGVLYGQEKVQYCSATHFSFASCLFLTKTVRHRARASLIAQV